MYSLALQNDSKVVLGGNFTEINTIARGHVARLENTNRFVSSVTLTSSPNPATPGQGVTFRAVTTPLTATGTIRFTFATGNSSSTGISIPLINGVATYVTNTLPAGTYTVMATYSGDSNMGGSYSPPYSQLITSSCNPQVVMSNSDDGQATTCGTFSYALLHATNGQTVNFALLNGNTVTFSGNLNPTLKSGVLLDGGASGVILNGNGATGDGLRLGGSNRLTNLTIRGFGGRELLATVSSTANQLFKVKVQD